MDRQEKGSWFHWDSAKTWQTTWISVHHIDRVSRYSQVSEREKGYCMGYIRVLFTRVTTHFG